MRLALQERDEALRRLEPRVAAVRRASAEGAREAREAERELNELLRERERLIQQNETAYERYQRRLANLSSLVERAERAGRAVPDETIQREAVAAMEELERAEERVQRGAERTSDTVRELGLTFSSGLRSILRHDPDIVLVGEIRDAETAEIAVRAAQTGHLVFSTLHTNDSVGAVVRLPWTWLRATADGIAGWMRRRGSRESRVALRNLELAYPELPADTLSRGTTERKKICRTFSDCTTAPRNYLPSGCYPLDPFYKQRPEAEDVKRVKQEMRD